MKRLTGKRRETLVLIGVTLAVAAELTWVVHHIREEVIYTPESAPNANQAVFTENVIHAAR